MHCLHDIRTIKQLLSQQIWKNKKSRAGFSEDTRSGFCGFECLKGHTMCEAAYLGISDETERGSFWTFKVVDEPLRGLFPVTLQTWFHDRRVLLEGRLQAEIRNISSHISETLILCLDRIVASVDKLIRAGGHEERMKTVIEVVEEILVTI